MFSRAWIIIIMSSALIILLLAWTFSNVEPIDAGFMTPRENENSRLNVLKKVAGFTDSVDTFEAFKRELLNPILVVRDVLSPGHSAVKQHIKSHFSSLGWLLEEDAFTDTTTPIGSVNFTNIIATTPFNSQEYLVLACHYDSKYYTEFSFIGATDSAVPCAILLDIAKSLNSFLNRSPQPKYGLKLIFFDGEEAFKTWSSTDSIYGARHLAEKMETTQVRVTVDKSLTQLQQIKLFVLLDLIGTKLTSFKNLNINTAAEFKKLENIENSMKTNQLLSTTYKTYFDSTFYNYNIGDDHIPFLNRGVPVVHLISVPFPTQWHTEGDKEDSLDYETIHDVMKIMRMFVVDYLGLRVD